MSGNVGTIEDLEGIILDLRDDVGIEEAKDVVLRSRRPPTIDAALDLDLSVVALISSNWALIDLTLVEKESPFPCS